MGIVPLVLVIISAVTHSVWNLYAKRGRDKQVFLWLMSLAAVALVTPVVVCLRHEVLLPMAGLVCALTSGLFVAAYFLCLGKAYEGGDLSLVYPLARSSPVFVLLLSVIFLREMPSALGLAGVLIICAGVYALHLRSFSPGALAEPITLLKRKALLPLFVALCSAIYSVIDKIGVGHIQPVIYLYLMFSASVVFSFPYILRAKGMGMVREEWRDNKRSILLAGLLN